ncbi:MAG: CRTAC1 family protein [Bacteroidetes bacterium]|nr:CRTAC1 family protein [Bacteroidota bacterium]
MEKKIKIKRLIQFWWTLLLLNISSFGQFTDITKNSGIDHQFKVFEGFLGGGACVIDFDNDGYEDVYLTTGTENDKLYRNNRNGTFSDVFEKSGLTKTKGYITQGVVSADVNKDGYRDLFITTISTRGKRQVIPRAENLLFLNNKNGTFSDVTDQYGLKPLNSFSTGASFGDVNADGYPDIYVGNYFNQYDGPLNTITDATVVGANQISESYLLINHEGKFFKNEYKEYGLTHKGFGFGGVFSDFDKDGDQDLIVNHDFGYKRTPNILYENLYPRKQFRDISVEKEMDLKINSMATAVGDYDGDGLLDYYFTNIRFNYLLKNQGPGKPFLNTTQSAGLNFLAISWGANFADFDNDGDLDLFVNNGDLNPNCVPMANFYYENQGNGKFIDKARQFGINDYGIGRGSILFDLDRDGDLDVLSVSQNPVLDFPAQSFTKIFRNDFPKNNWIQLKLVGKNNEIAGIGCSVEIESGGKIFIREVDGGSTSHLSQSSPILHFGLGNATKIDKIKVFWANGDEQEIKGVEVNKIYKVNQKLPNSFSKFWIIGVGVIALSGFLFFIKWKR